MYIAEIVWGFLLKVLHFVFKIQAEKKSFMCTFVTRH